MRGRGVRSGCRRTATAAVDTGMPVNPYSAHGSGSPLFRVERGRKIVPIRAGNEPFMKLYPYFHARSLAIATRSVGSLEGYQAPLAMPGLFEHA